MSRVPTLKRGYQFEAPSKLESLLEREFGRQIVEGFHVLSTGSPGLPIPIMGVGASAYRGTIIPRKQPLRHKIGRHLPVARRPGRQLYMTGFASLSDLIYEATAGGKAQDLMYRKVGAAPGATAGTSPLWNVADIPAAGGVGGTSGTGSVPVNTTTGGLRQVDPSGSDTLHFASWTGQSSVVGQILLYDRLWHMTYNHATATSTAVDANNRPARYQTAALAPGNWVTSEVTTVLSGTAHNLGITYVDQDGNTAEANTNVAVRTSSAVQTILFTAPQWMHILNSPDMGVRYLTNINQSTITSVTGVSSFVIGHSLAILPQPIANQAYPLDGINSAFNLVQIQTDACLALMDLTKSANTAATLWGIIKLVSG